MYKYAEFYKRSEVLFSGSIIDELDVNLDIEPESYIRVQGDCGIIIEGIHQGENVTEEVLRLSDYTFSYISKFIQSDCIANTFTGSIKAATSGGAPVPVDRRIFGISVQINQGFAGRSQTELGTLDFKEKIEVSFRDARASQLSIGDFAIIQGEPMNFRILDFREEGVNFFVMQLVYSR